MNPGQAAAGSLLEIENLSIAYRGSGVTVVRGVSFAVDPGETVAVVGESGSGKSTLAMAVMRLHQSGSIERRGKISLQRKTGEVWELNRLPEREMRLVRGNDVAMIFQEPMSSLDPFWRIGSQISEALRAHRKASASEARNEAVRLLRALHIPNPENCLASYPHQLSGGMRQRVMIAMAMACRPRLLIADEPTTALDPTIQAQIIDQLKLLQVESKTAMLFISHDLDLVAEIADRVVVMYAGQIVETASVKDLFERPMMPYTKALLRARPKLGSTETALRPIEGSMPDPANLPAGCAFHPRCGYSRAGTCDQKEPVSEFVAGRVVRCHFWRDIAA